MTHTSDESDQRIAVELDHAQRFSSVEIASLDDDLRDTGALGRAFDAAYAAALVAAAPPARPELVASGARPAGPIIKGRPPMPEPHSEPRWDLINAASLLEPDEDLTPHGASDNDCVHVRLDPGSSRGRLVDVDPGWLRQAAVSNLTAAIHQAFAAAYEKRDR